MSISSINQGAISFKGNNNTVKIGNKEVKKSTLAAAGVATAATVATIALGVAGKKNISASEIAGKNFIKKLGAYIKKGGEVLVDNTKALFKKAPKGDDLGTAVSKEAPKGNNNSQEIQARLAATKERILKEQEIKQYNKAIDDAVAKENAYFQKMHGVNSNAEESAKAFIDDAAAKENAYFQKMHGGSGKSAKESAEVFVIHEEALAAVEKEQKIKDAVAKQEADFQEKHGGSGKSAKESAEVFTQAEAAINGLKALGEKGLRALGIIK